MLYLNRIKLNHIFILYFDLDDFLSKKSNQILLQITLQCTYGGFAVVNNVFLSSECEWLKKKFLI